MPQDRQPPLPLLSPTGIGSVQLHLAFERAQRSVSAEVWAKFSAKEKLAAVCEQLRRLEAGALAARRDE